MVCDRWLVYKSRATAKILSNQMYGNYSQNKSWLDLGARGSWLHTCFPPLFTGQLHVFPRFSSLTCFPALFSGYIFSRAFHRWHVFPRFSPVTYFPALFTANMFSRAFHLLLVELVTCFGFELWLVYNIFCWTAGTVIRKHFILRQL